MDRFHISQTVAKAVYGDDSKAFIKKIDKKINDHIAYVREYGYDMPEILEWKWK